MIRSQYPERNSPPRPAPAAAASSFLDERTTLPFGDDSVPLKIAHSGVAERRRRVRCPSLPAKAAKLSNRVRMDRRDFFLSEGQSEEDSKDGSSFTEEEGRDDKIDFTSVLLPNETCSACSTNPGCRSKRPSSFPAKSATLTSQVCEDSLEFSISESESDDDTNYNGEYGTNFKERRDKGIDFPPDFVSIKSCDIHHNACSPQGIADLLHQLLRNRSWSDVIHLAELHPDAVSVPAPFSFRGEKSTATALHVATSLLPPRNVVEALVAAHPESVLGSDSAAGRLPVHVAIAAGASSGVVSYLLRCHAECGTRTDQDGNGVLHYAATFGTDEVIQRIVEDFERGLGKTGTEGNAGTAAAAAAVPNERGRTALHLLCARCCDVGEGGGHEEKEGGLSGTEAEEAAVASRLVAARSLLRACPSAASAVDIRGQSPLHAVCNSHNPMWDVVKLLLDEPGGPEMARSKDQSGRRPLDVLRAVNPSLLRKTRTKTKAVTTVARKEVRPQHPGLLQLIDCSEIRLRGEGSSLRKAAASIVPAQIRRVAASALHSSRRPTEEEISLNKKAGNSLTYPRHASPVTTMKRSYTLKF